MNQQEAEMLDSWKRGESIGSIAKRYGIDKQKVKKVINRVSKEARVSSPEVVRELPAAQAS